MCSRFLKSDSLSFLISKEFFACQEIKLFNVNYPPSYSSVSVLTFRKWKVTAKLSLPHVDLRLRQLEYGKHTVEPRARVRLDTCVLASQIPSAHKSLIRFCLMSHKSNLPRMKKGSSPVYQLRFALECLICLQARFGLDPISFRL